jgi:hypothetical protein
MISPLSLHDLYSATPSRQRILFVDVTVDERYDLDLHDNYEGEFYEG